MGKEIELKLEVPPQELRRLRPPVAKVAEASQIGCHDWSPNGSGDFDRARLFQFRARYEEREHAIAVLGANAVRIDLDRDGDRAVEYAADAFPPMDAGVLLVFALFCRRYG